MKKLIVIFIATVLTVSCQNLEDLNENKKDPTEAAGGQLFASAQKRLADQYVSPDVNENNLRLWVEHWQETTYPDESRYDQNTRAIPDNHWQTFYDNVLNDLDAAYEAVEENDDEAAAPMKPNRKAIIEIMTVFTYANLIETFGDVPYEESLDIDNTEPSYDNAKDTYEGLVDRLDDALESMDDESGFDKEEDLVYDGDAQKWKVFGNTLKFRMGMVLEDGDIVSSAYNDGIMESLDDNAAYEYDASQPNNNPIQEALVLSGRHDYVASERIVDMMNDLEDPRRESYFDSNVEPYEGGPIGEKHVWGNFTHVKGDTDQEGYIAAPDRPGIIMGYIETQFLLAEAAERGYISGNAEEYYTDGIKASFEKWRDPDDTEWDDKMDDYLDKDEVQYDPSNWKKSIGTQAWLALFNRTFAPYLSVRRLGYPALIRPYKAESEFPNRYTYPVDEQNLNETEWEEAVKNLGDDPETGDQPETKLFFGGVDPAEDWGSDFGW